MKAQLQAAMKDAMRAKDKPKLDTIRGILAAIQYEEMEKKVEPRPDAGILEVLQREIKKRREEIEFAEKANRPELITALNVDIQTIEVFLPRQLSADELSAIVTELRGSDPSLNMGGVMKILKERYAGQYDGRTASDLVKKIFA
ncbi:MAG: hypothetical protein RL417_291 [Pseudomonadota bacterium]